VKVVLVMFTPEGERRDVPMKHDRVTLGRDSSCDVRIPVAAVSRTHCRIEIEDSEVFVEDLGSRNGTYRNEDRISEREPLLPGDRLAVGPVVFTVQIDGDPEPVEPPLLESPMMAASEPGKPDADEDVPEAITKTKDADPEDSAAGISDLLADMEGSSEFDFDLSDLDDDDAKP
jgi:pSer/pThr/pTyr-binding forkhead associated (FHA) protein